MYRGLPRKLTCGRIQIDYVICNYKGHIKPIYLCFRLQGLDLVSGQDVVPIKPFLEDFDKTLFVCLKDGSILSNALAIAGTGSWASHI